MTTRERIRAAALDIEHIRDRLLAIDSHGFGREMINDLDVQARKLYEIANGAAPTVKPLTDESAAADVRNAITYLQEAIQRALDHGLKGRLRGGNMLAQVLEVELWRLV